MSDCKSCKHNSKDPIPYLAYESTVVRFERTIKRLWALVVLVVVLLVGTNCAWLWYESQYETITQTVTQDADNGTNNFIGGDLHGETND